jgi:hypothetical protein
MRKAIIAVLFLLLTGTSAICQQQLNAATKEDVEDLLTITGSRARMQQLWSQMGQQAATSAADAYRLKHPDASPLELRKVAEATGRSFQDELLDAMIPVYQQHLTHADIRGIIDFYNSEPGQKYLKEMPALMSESMEAVQPIIKKHLPEMQAAADKAIHETMKDAPASKDEDGSK